MPILVPKNNGCRLSCWRILQLIMHGPVILITLPSACLETEKERENDMTSVGQRNTTQWTVKNQWRQKWSVFTSFIFRDRPVLPHWFSVLIELCSFSLDLPFSCTFHIHFFVFYFILCLFSVGSLAQGGHFSFPDFSSQTEYFPFNKF